MTVTIDPSQKGHELMYACLECGQRLPPRAKGGHQERKYCSDRCRQRAYRKQKKQGQNIEQIIHGAYGIPIPDPRVTRDHWRFERTGLLQRYKLLEAEYNVAQAEVKFLEGNNAILEDRLRITENILADKEAEIVRLNVLLDSQSKRKR